MSPLGSDMLSARTPDRSGQIGKLEKDPLLSGKVLCEHLGGNTRTVDFSADRDNTSPCTKIRWSESGCLEPPTSYSSAPVHYYFPHLSETLRH